MSACLAVMGAMLLGLELPSQAAPKEMPDEDPDVSPRRRLF
jgi:hypothetical protein